VFEDEAVAEQATIAVEKTIHHEGPGDNPIGEPGIEVGHLEETQNKKE